MMKPNPFRIIDGPQSYRPLFGNVRDLVRVRAVFVAFLLVLVFLHCHQRNAVFPDYSVFDKHLHGSWILVEKSDGYVAKKDTGSVLIFTDSCFVTIDTCWLDDYYPKGNYELFHKEGLWYSVRDTLTLITLFTSMAEGDTVSHTEHAAYGHASFNCNNEEWHLYSFPNPDTLFLRWWGDDTHWMKYVKK